MIEFGATVNGEERTVIIEPDDLPQWLGLVVTPDDDDLDAIEQIIMNTEGYYREFYYGATSAADYDAELTDRHLDVT